jgi:hypothetical protein
MVEDRLRIVPKTHIRGTGMSGSSFTGAKTADAQKRSQRKGLGWALGRAAFPLLSFIAATILVSCVLNVLQASRLGIDVAEA